MAKTPAIVSAAEAVSNVKSGDSVYFSCFGCTPEILIEELCNVGRSGKLCNVKLIHTILLTEATYATPEFDGIFETYTFFVGDSTRKAAREGRVQYIPISLHETQTLFRDGYMPIDVAFIAVSPPDRHGYVSLGLSVDMTLAVVQHAKRVIAVINPNIPRTFGDALIPYSSIDMVVHDDRPIKEVIYPAPSAIDKTIGLHCAELINDGDCLQLGIGSIPNAILSLLENHRDLGLHTEMFSDGVIPLVEKEVITGRYKKIDQGKLVACFLMGSHKLHAFINDNPLVLMKDVRYTNDPFIIAQNPNVVSINSAIEVDITGQICADSIGQNIYSGVGGQLDFIYGASRSPGGRAIIAMSSCTNKGVSKIVPTLTQGAGVVTPRSMIHHFITEYGRVDLYGKSLQERAKLLISIAHPSVREDLAKAARERFGDQFKI
ncbi:MAG: acetyl-CoA hydrolase/transferase family protein [Lentisphaeria bacterium]|nr:acetyl-CoA hydrolase/transferase family protein [Lentisphaeria bacterium]